MQNSGMIISWLKLAFINSSFFHLVLSKYSLGYAPLNMLSEKSTPLRSCAASKIGICPVKLLYPTSTYSSFDRYLQNAGIVPLILLLCISINYRSFKKIHSDESDNGPCNLLYAKFKYSSLCKFSKEFVSFPFIPKCCILISSRFRSLLNTLSFQK